MLLLICLLFSFLSTTPHEVSAQKYLTGTNILEIREFNAIVTKRIITGSYIQSDLFAVGGYQWALEFYPQGWNRNFADSVSIILRLMNPGNAVAIFTVRLREWNTSTWSTDTPAEGNVCSFTPSTPVYGWTGFIKRSKLEASSYLRNDTLQMLTTIWVAKDRLSIAELPILSNNTDGSTGDNGNPGNVASAYVFFDNNKNQENA